MQRFTVIFVLCALAAGCNGGFKPRVSSPWHADFLENGPPNSPTMFRQGWHDGCQTATSATANSFQRMFYDYKQDYYLLHEQPDPTKRTQYYLGWKQAFTYCHRYIFQYLRRRYM
ncbi:MAG: hypothetical protein ABW189_03335 [Rickettsiales bacterium]